MSKKQPVVMIYKRTHKGDPGQDGIFGINGCMGGMRKREYDAVIGIGGKRPWSRDKDIACRINWIGITPTKHNDPKGDIKKRDRHYLLTSF
jgi:hypothetical protein